MRVILIGFTIVLVVLCCGLAVRYNQDANRAMDQFNEELYKRITAEENFQKAKIEIDSLREELKRMEARVVQTELVLEKTKQMNADLKLRLHKAEQAQEVIDKKVEELQILGL